MKKAALAVLLVLCLFSACKDKPTIQQPPEVHPQMNYINLYEAEVKFGDLKSIDINKDGIVDFHFSTLLVGDPILQRDRRQYYLHSRIDTYLLHDANDESPVLNNDDSIALYHPGLQWHEIGSIVLAEKIIPAVGQPSWQGSWKQAGHKYLPVQVKKNGLRYNGWIEASFDTTLEKLVLHKAAICLEPGKTIKAGF